MPPQWRRPAADRLDDGPLRGPRPFPRHRRALGAWHGLPDAPASEAAARRRGWPVALDRVVLVSQLGELLQVAEARSALGHVGARRVAGAVHLLGDLGPLRDLALAQHPVRERRCGPPPKRPLVRDVVPDRAGRLFRGRHLLLVVRFPRRSSLALPGEEGASHALREELLPPPLPHVDLHAVAPLDALLRLRAALQQHVVQGDGPRGLAVERIDGHGSRHGVRQLRRQ
mmetsp:Transcript_91646/g.264306  ORF Transcript_91646/g.264306 Transcript_91646/m.264306 type:complete len:228 (-) Transcript_91646:283-966(-)